MDVLLVCHVEHGIGFAPTECIFICNLRPDCADWPVSHLQSLPVSAHCGLPWCVEHTFPAHAPIMVMLKSGCERYLCARSQCRRHVRTLSVGVTHSPTTA